MGMSESKAKKPGKKKTSSKTGMRTTGKKKGRSVREEPNATRAMLIVNPVAGNGASIKIWEDLQETLHVLGVDFDYHFSEYREHAMEIASDAALSGYGKVVVVGGDGTLFEVVNGLMTAGRKKRPELAVIPCGRGSDFCRSLEIPQDWTVAASLLVSGRKRTIDVGWMEYRGREGVRTGYFANIAGLGFDGEVTERANNMPESVSRVVGGTATYLLSLLITYARYREKDVELQVDDTVYRVLATTVVIANGQYFGGKMRIAPDARYDDGMFDVVVLGAGFGPPILEMPAGEPAPSYSRAERSAARARMAKNVPRVYKGTHVHDESVMVARGRKVRVISDDRMVLQADGEVIGEGPVAAEIIPGAIDVIA